MTRFRLATLFAIAAVSLGGAVLWHTPGAAAQSGGEAVLRITPPVDVEAKEGGDPIPFEIAVENIENLGGFGFVVQFDHNVFEYDSAQRGEFLGSSGREVACNEPVSADGSVRLSCNTLRPEPAGPDGNGVLMTVLLRPTGSGTTEVNLDRVKLVNPDSTPIEPVTTQAATLDVEATGGFNWLIWGPLIGVAVLAVAGAIAFGASRMRSGSSKPATAM
jgi:hypothetical protein